MRDIFDRLDVEDTPQIILEEHLHNTIYLSLNDKSGSLLRANHLSMNLALLSNLKEFITCARLECESMQSGRADISSTAILVSMIYAETKASSSQTALLVDKWTEVDSWVSCET